MVYDNVSNDELYLLLEKRYPAVAETVGRVTDSNKEAVIALMRFLSDPRRDGDA
jgi:hypothetical protein